MCSRKRSDFHNRRLLESVLVQRSVLTNTRAQFWSVDLVMQERFTNIPGQTGCFGMVAGARVAEESVIRFRNLHIHIRLGLPLALVNDRSNLILADMLIAAAPEK